MHRIETIVQEDAAVAYPRKAWRMEGKGCSGHYDLSMYAHVQGFLGPISETDSAGRRTSYFIATRPLGAGRGSLIISCIKRVAGCDMPRCCKERTCLTREGRKRKRRPCAGRSGLEERKRWQGCMPRLSVSQLQGFSVGVTGRSELTHEWS
jgi:hypothetical protein